MALNGERPIRVTAIVIACVALLGGLSMDVTLQLLWGDWLYVALFVHFPAYAWGLAMILLAARLPRFSTWFLALGGVPIMLWAMGLLALLDFFLLPPALVYLFAVVVALVEGPAMAVDRMYERRSH